MAKSFFAQLQDQMQFVVKLVLTLSITFFGVKILLGGGGIKKSDLLMYVIKIGLVMYFATGDAWQTMFFDGIYGASTVFSQMVFKAQTPADPTKRDGCQFGNVNLDNDDATLVSVSKYPLGKEYLAIWDTLDCKITRYLGFGPELSTANVAKLIFAGFFTHPIGIYFSLCLLLFGLILISCAIRALHIFLSSAIAILIMVYVSPLVIPLSLFKKTNGIFKGWLKQIISFSLQPMILFAYLAIFVSVMDKTLIGSATFYGDPPFRAIQCASYCQDALGNIVNNQNCDGVGQKFVTPKADSIACMVSNNAFGNWPGLELIGIALPFLLDFLTDHIREKILTIIKAVLVMYFLYQFLDEVPGICSQLIGGATLPGSKSDGVANLKSLHKYVSAIQQRANRAAKKWLPKGAKGARNAIRNIGSALDKGKSVEDGGGGNSVNSGGSSGGGGGKGNSSKDGNNSAGN